MSVQPTNNIVLPVWTFGDRVRKARSIAGMDQREFASAIGVTHPALGAWESGRGKPRDIVSVAKRVELLTRVPAVWTLGLNADSPSGEPGGESADACTPRDLNPEPID